MKLKKILWLEEANFKSPSKSFLRQMDEQLRPLFEVYFNRKLNWDKLWLYFETLPIPIIFEEKEGMKFTRLICQLRYGYYSIDCEIKWMNQDGTKHIDPDFYDSEEQLIFSILSIKDDHNRMKDFPGMEDNKPLKLIHTSTSFPVVLLDGVFSAEGNFLISLKNESIAQEVLRIFMKAHASWNDDTLELYSYPLNRGKLHEICLSGYTDDCIACFYFDIGTAIDGIHEYLISSLKTIEDDIKKVEVKAI